MRFGVLLIADILQHHVRPPQINPVINDKPPASSSNALMAGCCVVEVVFLRVPFAPWLKRNLAGKSRSPLFGISPFGHMQSWLKSPFGFPLRRPHFRVPFTSKSSSPASNRRVSLFERTPFKKYGVSKWFPFLTYPKRAFLRENERPKTGHRQHLGGVLVRLGCRGVHSGTRRLRGQGGAPREAKPPEGRFSQWGGMDWGPPC